MASRVFLSSTYTDLAGHRKVVQAAIRQLGATDVSMEHFGARDERPLEECTRLVREESDIFVGIYAHKYGFVPDGHEVSISELEYRAATEASLFRLVYIIDDNHPWPPLQIDTGDKANLLQSFKTSLRKRHICQSFGTEDQLATKVVADLGRHLAVQRAPKIDADVQLPDIGLESLRGPVVETPNDWNRRRNAIYDGNRNLFLTHIIRPSSKEGQLFDVSIYLIRHKSDDLSDIRLAEFFLGPYWSDRVFPMTLQDGFIGISTSAYGTFLCLCKVTFLDGHAIYLERYVDFEMQRTGGVGG